MHGLGSCGRRGIVYPFCDLVSVHQGHDMIWMGKMRAGFYVSSAG